MNKGKRYAELAKLIDKSVLYDPTDAAKLVCETGKAKFDETVELHVRLGVDSRHADQQVRGAVVLPHGTGRTKRVLVLAKGPKADEAQAAGADFVGDDDMINKIQNENWFDFDVIVATPDMMGKLGRLGKVLGPKGLMPNPKAGTVTMDVAKAVLQYESIVVIHQSYISFLYSFLHYAYATILLHDPHVDRSCSCCLHVPPDSQTR